MATDHNEGKGGAKGPGDLPGPKGAALSSYYGMPEAGRGSGATGDEKVPRATDSDLAGIGKPSQPDGGFGKDGAYGSRTPPHVNDLADGSEDPLAEPVDLGPDAFEGSEEERPKPGG